MHQLIRKNWKRVETRMDDMVSKFLKRLQKFGYVGDILINGRGLRSLPFDS
jgi:hypothetical protein